MPWRIEHQFSYGWDDAGWTTEVAGRASPSRFPSQGVAEAAIDEFIAETKEAAEVGGLEEMYDRKDFRAVEVP